MEGRGKDRDGGMDSEKEKRKIHTEGKIGRKEGEGKGDSKKQERYMG